VRAFLDAGREVARGALGDRWRLRLDQLVDQILRHRDVGFLREHGERADTAGPLAHKGAAELRETPSGAGAPAGWA
jgi:hypothetical protein